MQEVSVISDSLKKDIDKGLSANQKYIPSKYFYDDEGSRIFQQIMRMPEYYLTDCEYEIFEKKKENILNSIRLNGEAIDLIELGAGDGMKTSLLIDHFIRSGVSFKYVPVDISEEAITQLVNKMETILCDDLVKNKIVTSCLEYKSKAIGPLALALERLFYDTGAIYK